MNIYQLLVWFIATMPMIEGKTRQSLCLIEGDIRCSRKSRNLNTIHKQRSRYGFNIYQKRSYANGPKDTNTLWPTRTIPYKIESEYSTSQLALLNQAMKTIETYTCLRFSPINGQRVTDYVNILLGKGCFSDVGRVGGEQQLSLDLDCFNEKTVYHELLHTIGFWHEHNRPDRDRYIQVLRENIDIAHLGNFKISDEYTVETGPWDYDYYSVMHYKYTDYSRDGKLPTILPIDTKIKPEDLGKSNSLTKQDIDKINVFYRCDLKSCSRPILNEHVILLTSFNDYSIGSKVSYSCDAGYTLIGSSIQICLSTGVWSGQNPRCLPIVSHYCDFESQQSCGWTSSSSGDIDWEISSGRHHYRTGTGPLNDLTLGTLDGHFLRLDTQNLDPGLKAIISTPILPLQSNGITFCLNIGYYMWGLVVGSLKATLITQQGSSQQLFSISGAARPKWVEQSISFVPSGPFRIEFEGTIGSDLGDIALDDVSIEPCSAKAISLVRLKNTRINLMKSRALMR